MRNPNFCGHKTIKVLALSARNSEKEGLLRLASPLFLDLASKIQAGIFFFL